MLTRRAFLAASSALLCSCSLLRREQASVEERLREIGRRSGGRLGVHALDTGNGRRIDLDGDQRFAMASTFKLPLAAAVLARCDRGALALDKRVAYGPSDLLPHAPVTEKNLARGYMTIEELCAAIVTVSDNPAANLLLAELGGPASHARAVSRIKWRSAEVDERTSP
jgi:beta-lactamase class A